MQAAAAAAAEAARKRKEESDATALAAARLLAETRADVVDSATADDVWARKAEATAAESAAELMAPPSTRVLSARVL